MVLDLSDEKLTIAAACDAGRKFGADCGVFAPEEARVAACALCAAGATAFGMVVTTTVIPSVSVSIGIY